MPGCSRERKADLRALLGEDGAGAAHIFNASFPETTYGVGCKVKHLSSSIKS